VTGDGKGRLAWWREDLDKVQEVAAHPRLVYRVRYRPDGRQCASIGDDGVVRLWAPDGKSAGVLDLPERRDRDLYALAYSPDGRQLAAAGQDGRIYVWNVPERRLLHTLPGHQPPEGGTQTVVTLAYGPAHRLFSGGADGTIRAWDTALGRSVGRLGRHEPNAWGNAQTYSLAVRPDGRQVASCGADATIRIWDVESGRLLARLEGGPVRFGSSEAFPFVLATSAFCAHQHVLVTANGPADAFLRSWDTRTLRERRTYTGLPELHDDIATRRVSALAIHPDASTFVSAEPNGDLLWWDAVSGKQLARSRTAHQPWQPDRLANLARSWKLNLARVAAGGYSWRAVTALAWSHDGNRVASAGIDGTLQLWDARGQPVGKAWQEENAGTRFPALAGSRSAPDYSAAQLAVARFFGSLLGMSVESPQSILLFDRGGHLITGGQDTTIRLWKLGAGTPKIVDRLQGHARRVNAATLSADGQLLASGSEDGFVLIWDLKRRRILRMTALEPLRRPDPLPIRPGFSEHELVFTAAALVEQYAVVRSLAFSPDARWLAVVLQDGSVSLVDVTTGAVAYRGIGHETDAYGKSIVTAYFTREGELLTVGADQTVRHWDLPAWSSGRRILRPLPGALFVSRAWDPDGCVLLAAGAVLHWGRHQNFLQEARGIRELAPSGKTIADPAVALGCGRADGKVVVATQQGRVLVLDVPTGKTVSEFKGRDGKLARPSQAVAVQPGGALAAVGWQDGTVDLWRIEDGRWVRALEGGWQRRGRPRLPAGRPPVGGGAHGGRTAPLERRVGQAAVPGRARPQQRQGPVLLFRWQAPRPGRHRSAHRRVGPSNRSAPAVARGPPAVRLRPGRGRRHPGRGLPSGWQVAGHRRRRQHHSPVGRPDLPAAGRAVDGDDPYPAAARQLVDRQPHLHRRRPPTRRRPGGRRSARL
jgi:WD40 repeat protein